ncbi:hypothetical protein K437DRAFT_251199 [Tilletiaria anomala UBC 951]|uniref:UBA domain-containing protein n=1 Tax=Tilletiaria anomala (strain ATCC 24038 / CBS 436.72 / UBC 951) TaxID=1037660 RepID=A0A066VJ68_TILAU|nr:uncharacterized protein K437DRAFT_251199 [Tilletiaria anomala UBC 951]KDN38650.1 hypothetical protein K437DRAFT_251199 [Tilletiaria anomala UBC 951]
MDDLLDLDWSKPAESNKGIGTKPTASAGSVGPPACTVGSSTYNFDALTRALPSGSGGSTPARNGSPALTAAGHSSPSQLTSTKGAASGGQDAFASLFRSSTGGVAKPNPAAQNKLTLAERQKSATSAFGSGASTSAQTKDTGLNWGAADDWDFLGEKSASKANSCIQRPTAAPVPQPPANKPATIPSVTRELTHDPFDFSAFEDSGTSQSSAIGGRPGVDADPFSPTAFRNTQTTKDAEGDVDDILGALAQPASQAAKPVPQPALAGNGARKGATSNSPNGSRPTSPPPHLIGKLVELGFAPSEARAALASTESGTDVQAAAEVLLSRRSASTPSTRPGRRNGTARGGSHGRSSGDDEGDRELAERLQREERQCARASDREPAAKSDGLRTMKDEFAAWQQREATRNNGTASRSERFADDSDSAIPPDWAKSADQIYAQASEIGTAVFSRANAFWNTAKASAAKVLEERRIATSAGGSADQSERDSGRSTPVSGDFGVAGGTAARALQKRLAGKDAPPPRMDGRPRWMVDAAATDSADDNEMMNTPSVAGQQHSSSHPAASESFKDSDDDDDAPKPTFVPPRPRPEKSRPAPAANSERKAPASSSERLAAQEEPAVYISPTRRGKARELAQNGPTAALSAAAASRPVGPPVHQRTRVTISDPPDIISRFLALKQAGNAHFQKGAYGDAETSYTKCLEALPDSSLRRIPALNNRASTRLKNGDSAAAMRDCENVMKLINPTSGSNSSDIAPYRPKEEAPLPPELAAEVNLRDAWAKALLRHAQGAEALERWTTARKSWNLLLVFEKEEGSGKNGVTNMRTAQEGLRRCMKMISGGKDKSAAPIAKPSRAAAAAAAKAQKAAVSKLAAQNAAKEAEDAQKLSLKDTVDAKVATWKGGKETNVRALVSSVDTVLWPELNWKKIGMHELVTDAQVKKNYTKAIARLHPDKVSAPF